MRKILLHVGSPKCGSTYLQHTLLKNQEKLLGARVNYPHDGGTHPGNASKIETFSHERIKSLFVHADTVILSHEDLFSRAAKAKSLAAICKSLNIQVKVVVFLRPFNEFIFGDYSQFLKQYFDEFLTKREAYGGRSFEQFTVDRANNLSTVGYLKSWEAVFPESKLLLESHKNIRSVFEPLLDAPDLSWNISRDKTNPSLRMEDCDRIARAINNHQIPKSQVRKMFKDAFHSTQERDLGKTDCRISWIEAIFKQKNQRLLEEFNFDNRRASNL